MKDKPKIIYNQDCTNVFVLAKEPFQISHINAMIDEVAGAGIGVMLINPNAQRTSHPSKVWNTLWDNFDDYFTSDIKKEFWSCIPEPYKCFDLRKHYISQMKHFAENGNDYLAVALERCKEKNICPGISVRMNDMHDGPWPDSHLHSEFYKNNAQFHLSNIKNMVEWADCGLNYEFEEVRDHYLAYIRELVNNYSFCWLELDFLRHPYYFPQERAHERCDVMTGFIKEIRSILDNNKREVTLSVRLAPSPETALRLGFDVKNWAHMKLINAISFGNYYSTAWNMPVEKYREAVGSDVMLYPSSDNFAYKNRYEQVSLPTKAELVNGFYFQNTTNGADGIELFNFFVSREPRFSEESNFSALRKLTVQEEKTRKIKIVIATSVQGETRIDLPQKNPSSTNDKDFPLSFDFAFPDPANLTGNVHVHIFLVAIGQDNHMKVRINENAIQATSAKSCEPENGDFLLEFEASILRKGRNKLAFPSSIKRENIDCIYITAYSIK